MLRAPPCSACTWPTAAALDHVGVSVGPQVSVPGAEDELLLSRPPGSRVRVLLTDVAFDGAELQGGEGAPADHAEHPVPRRIELHQVFGSPTLMVVTAVVPTRDSAPARARCP